MVTTKNENGRAGLDDVPATLIQGPCLSPPEEPLRIALQQSHTGMAGRVEREIAAGGDEGLLATVPVTFDVHLRVPALLLEGRSLPAPGGGPIGLGNVHATVAGDLHLRKTPDTAMQVTGEVQTVRGSYEFQGRDFSIVRGGGIQFAGLEELNPGFDVTALRTVSGVEARVHIGGTLEQPRLSLSSQPPLEQADILSLILFGRSVNRLGVVEHAWLTRRAAAMAAGLVAGELTRALDRALGLDLVDIEAGFLDGAFAPALTLGQQFGDLFVQVHKQFSRRTRTRSSSSIA